MVQGTRAEAGRKSGEKPDKGWSLDFAGSRILRPAMAVALLAVLLPSSAAFARASGAPTNVIVHATPTGVVRAQNLVNAAGGHIVRQLPIIDGFSAKVPSGAVALLKRDASIVSVTANARLRPQSDGYSSLTDMGSMFNVTLTTGAQAMWGAGYTGNGVDVALIDSGVVPVDGLKGQFVNGPDLSFESQSPDLRYLDTFGHGTHLGGIIAGRASAAVNGGYVGDYTNFLGMAPDSRLVSIKVADAHGSTDVSQVIAAIDWVVQHRRDNGMNIRILNLSYGTNSTQDSSDDPLAFAAEVAWRRGIVVVAAAGNKGYAATGSLTDPASDPWILAVGSADTNGTTTMVDDTVSSFSSSSNWGSPSQDDRLVDLVAPGAHIVSLRDPGSQIDINHGDTGLVGTTLFRGSGTSQAAAVVSGAVALILQQRPDLKPDEVKRLLTTSATTINAGAASQGNGELNLATGLAWPDAMVLGYNQANYIARGNGKGSLEGSRGDYHLVMNSVTLAGSKDIFGHAFNSAAMANAESNANTWWYGVWNGNTWSGNSWSGNSWSCVTWSGNSWSGNSWSGVEWTGNSWSGNSWSGNSWSDNNWSGNSWSNNSWSSKGWN
jgi:serine protease AprX